jgi:hypothetical protein
MADDQPSKACYLAEIFTPRCKPEEQRAQAELVHAASDALAGAGVPVLYLQSLFVPGEELALYLVEAEEPASVAHALHEAGLEAERISPAIEIAGRAEAGAPAARDPERQLQPS